MSEHHFGCSYNPRKGQKCDCGEDGTEQLMKNKKVKPISPDEVINKKKKLLPDGVIEAFNELIAKNWDGNQSVIDQDDVVNLICEKVGDGMGNSAPRRLVFDNNWLNVEEIYEAQGWEVEYDKPGYNEVYSASFIFSRDGKRMIL